MSKQFLFIMDPIEAINIKKDSSFAVMLAAQKAGHTLYYATANDLFLRDGYVYVKMAMLRAMDDEQHWFDYLSPFSETKIDALDIIWMRVDPPVNNHYLTITHLLDFAEKSGVRVINKPSSIRDCNEKLFAQWFPHLCPPTLVSKNLSQLNAFLIEQGRIILKPLNGMGGRGVFYLDIQDKNKNMILDTVTEEETQFVMAQRFLPDIAKGDKRVTMINGEPIDYAVARIPPPDDIRGNLAAGGTAKVIPLSQHDRWLCKQIGNTLKEKGLFWVGVDIIGDYITEINVTSPTCLREVENDTQQSIAELIIRNLF